MWWVTVKNMPAQTPELSPRWTDPRPVWAVGMALFLAATALSFVGGPRFADTLPICLWGIAVGIVGYLIFTIQRRGARRRRKGAQIGLNS